MGARWGADSPPPHALDKRTACPHNGCMNTNRTASEITANVVTAAPQAATSEELARYQAVHPTARLCGCCGSVIVNNVHPETTGTKFCS